ncbi:MAG: RNA polymerase sigma factor [Bacteroidetes bacterium]|nr:RNA polymerase sigma factor [Bacteroidota bacterium]MBU1720603.1 RNA polymerase sigma factor [Bacteroidota bacterium]
MISDHEIIEGCRKGKRRFQDLLYRQSASALLVICYRYIGNRMEAEDVLHDTFIKIYKGIRNFNITDNGSLNGWMKRIAVNTALNYIRDNKKRSFEVIVDEEHTVDIVQDDDDNVYLLNDVEPEVIMKMIAEMPEGYRAVFNMYVFDQYSHQEIASSLGISINTSKTQLRKARLFLQKELHKKKTGIALTA